MASHPTSVAVISETTPFGGSAAISPTQEGKVERGTVFLSPIGETPFGNWLPKGRHFKWSQW